MRRPTPLTAYRRARIEAILWQWLAHVQRAERTELRKLIANALRDIEAARPYPWLNEKEVTERYPFNVVTLRKLRWKGKGPPYYRPAGSQQIRTRIFYHADELDAYLAERRIAKAGFRINANEPLRKTDPELEA